MTTETVQSAQNKKRLVTLDKPWKEILYAVSGFGPNLLMVLLGAYFTDAINPAALPEGSLQAITTVSLILPAIFPILWMLAKIFDGLIDIPLAALTDRLRTKWGRRRIPIAIAFIPMVVSYALMWIPIGGEDQLVNTIWITTMALIFFASYTMCLIAFYGSLSNMCANENQRIKVSSYKAFFDTIVYALVYALVPITLEKLGVHIDKFTFMLLPLMVTMLIPLFMIKEGDKWEKKMINEGYDITPLKEEEKVGVWESIKLTFTNKVFLRWLIVNLCSFFGLQMFLVAMNALILGGMGLTGAQMTILNTFAFAPVPIMLYLFKKVRDKKGLRFAYQISLVSFSVAIFAFLICNKFVLGEGNATLKIVIGTLGSIIGSWAIGSFFMMPYMIPAQISSVEEKLTKRNHSAMYFAAQAVTSSVVGAIASSLVYEYIKMLFVSKAASGIVYAESLAEAATKFGVAENTVFNLGVLLVPVIVALFCMIAFGFTFLMPKNYSPKIVAKSLGLEKEYQENKHLFIEEKDQVVEEEVLGVNIVLFLLSGSIFGAIWRYGILKNINAFKEKKIGVVHYIVSLLFPPYFAYVVYVANKALVKKCHENGLKVKDLSVLYLILSLIGLNIISYIIMQVHLNKLAKKLNV